ncbi:MAG: EAL domain-containing protein [Cohaesibacter sp.]|jgi:diguanylate cyclase (GGDEF)-like protein/PAS domain S-box-containing protein|nr:EAL domain-containing protein [Cohaesibacter sp.]
MLITLLLVNIPLVFVFYNVMENSLTAEFDERNRTLLSTNASSLSKPLWDFDHAVLPEWAKSILLEENIVKVRIYDDKKNLIASASQLEDELLASSSSHQILTQTILYNVDGNTTSVGMLEIHVDKSGVTQAIWATVGKALLLLVISIAAVVTTALIANKYVIAEPLAKLTKAINATHDTGKQQRAEYSSNDEIGKVAKNFNDMQSRLEKESSRIHEAYSRLTALYNHTPALLYSLDQHGHIRAVSDFWLFATGYFEEEVLGKPFSDFISSCSLETYNDRKSFLQLAPGEFSETTCLFQRRDGSLFEVLIRESITQDGLSDDCLSLAVMTDISSLKRAEEALRLQATTDSLTGLLNRDGFAHHVKGFIDLSEQSEIETAMVFLDLDRFKWVNDNLGHTAGDELLKIVAGRLTNLVGPNQHVGRFGGDEFSILLQGSNAREDAVALSREIMKALSLPIDLHGHAFELTTSIGISIYPDHAQSADELIKTADVAMYHQKKSGRNGYCVFNRRLGRDAGRFLETEHQIIQALANDWFELHLQPIVNLQSNKIAGFEALLRLNHPEKGLLPPADIIATAEQTSHILEIGNLVIQQAIGHLKQFKDYPHLEDCYIAINLSAAQFLPGLPAKLASALMENDIQPNKLVLEITETVLMQSSSNLETIFSAIKELGCSFALDDFGTGYSSLSYMNKFPVDIVKIDRSFISMMASDNPDCQKAKKTQTLVEGILVMSHQLGLSVVAEGIETAPIATKLADLGTDLGQGYHFSRPLPIESFINPAQLKLALAG